MLVIAWVRNFCVSSTCRLYDLCRILNLQYRLSRSLSLPRRRHLTQSPKIVADSLSMRNLSSYSSSTAPLYSGNQYWTLHELVRYRKTRWLSESWLPSLFVPCSQGRYSEAITFWEQAKAARQIEDPSIYTAVMSVCEKIGSGEAAIAVREDMEGQRWSMNAR